MTAAKPTAFELLERLFADPVEPRKVYHYSDMGEGEGEASTAAENKERELRGEEEEEEDEDEDDDSEEYNPENEALSLEEEEEEEEGEEGEEEEDRAMGERPETCTFPSKNGELTWSSTAHDRRAESAAAGSADPRRKRRPAPPTLPRRSGCL
ncbi:uncharacterized protein ACO6RY_04652 [Pungitius sinensis]